MTVAQFNTLALVDIVIHRVPSRSDGDANGPILSQAPSPKGPRVCSFFRQRLSGVMARKGLARTAMGRSKRPHLADVGQAANGLVGRWASVICTSDNCSTE